MSTDHEWTTGIVKLALLAGPVNGDDVETRRRGLADAIASAPDANLLVLPYLPAQPVFWDRIDRTAAFRHAERPPAPSLRIPQKAAQERGIPLLATVYEVLGEGVFYALAEVRGADGELLCSYSQWHAVNRPGLHEPLYFQPGSGNEAPVFLCGGLRIGLLMGGDLWVPEAARLLRLTGAQAILAVTALPEALVDRGETLACARSIENGVPVVLANRGSAPKLFFDSDDPGRMSTASGWTSVELQPDAIRQQLRRDDPLMIRRPRLYAPISQRWEEKNA